MNLKTPRVLSGLIITLLLALLTACEQREIKVDNLPWQISVNEAGNLQLFDITLEETTLWDAVKTWHAHPTVGIFSKGDEPESVEAYFDKVQLGPISAKIVVRLAATPEQLQMLWAGRYNREPQPSGAWKFELGDKELEAAHALKIREITYIPTPSSDAELITKRFGKPAKYRALEEERSLWLYPDKGLAIILDENGKELFQYVNPSRFPTLEKRLEALQ